MVLNDQPPSIDSHVGGSGEPGVQDINTTQAVRAAQGLLESRIVVQPQAFAKPVHRINHHFCFYSIRAGDCRRLPKMDRSRRAEPNDKLQRPLEKTESEWTGPPRTAPSVGPLRLDERADVISCSLVDRGHCRPQDGQRDPLINLLLWFRVLHHRRVYQEINVSLCSKCRL